jgi:CDP-glucose 4,6-dehydratase
MRIRYPEAVRPWQHVLALVQAYFMLLAALAEDPVKYGRAWNFGPTEDRWYSVRDVLALMGENWRKPEIEYQEQTLVEAQTLSLDSGMARRLLGWIPAWDTRRSIEETARWYRAYYEDPAQARALSESQIEQWRERIFEPT